MTFTKFFRGSCVLALLWIIVPCELLAFPVRIASAPLSNLELTLSAIRSAKYSLHINIYEFTSPEIAEAIIDKIRSGVHVSILEEGQPVGGMSAAGRGIQVQIVQAMRARHTKNRFYEMTSKAGGKRRFRFNHAKYIVVDEESLLIGSENYTPTGHPVTGTLGNRGWEAWVQEKTIAKTYKDIFDQDVVLTHKDIIDRIDSQDILLQPESQHESSTVGHVPSNPMVLDAKVVRAITSPESSLSGLISLLKSARRTLDIELMSLDSFWEKGTVRSPLISEMIAAAQRGVRVRVLLNDDAVFGHPSNPSKLKNVESVRYLNEVAKKQRIDLTAAIANLQQMGVTYIHNKGVLVDQDRTLISSINWGENSVVRNREAAIILEGAAIQNYYRNLFEADWVATLSMTELLQREKAEPFNLMHLFESYLSETLEEPETSLQPAESSEMRCPSQLSVHATIGPLDVRQTEDQVFRELENTTLESQFVLSSNTPRVCVFLEADGHAPIARRRYIQIRVRPDQSTSIALEGYTTRGSKLYSIRTHSPNSKVDGKWNAALYDGSGPSRNMLGKVRLRLESRE